MDWGSSCEINILSGIILLSLSMSRMPLCSKKNICGLSAAKLADVKTTSPLSSLSKSRE